MLPIGLQLHIGGIGARIDAQRLEYNRQKFVEFTTRLACVTADAPHGIASGQFFVSFRSYYCN
jgi:hypothetical protein